MAFSGLISFLEELEKYNELLRIKPFTDPVLEITEVTDRVVKSGGKALLFENTGTSFPLLINAFGSDKRLALALGHKSMDEVATEIGQLFELITGNRSGLLSKINALPKLLNATRLFPSRSSSRGACQAIVHMEPDLGILPILKCWPHDGGRFITLPLVHTIHPITGKTNVGMYRMQVLDSKTTGMHWQRHKTGANHFEAWKIAGRKMPVSVALGGDPVYTYAATAPLPENIDEYILAGFLRKKKVKLVKCITNDLHVPADADIIIEGYVDPSEAFVKEGPFGDHTGFYSLADLYPAFHVTCITHARDAVYPATIVGIPPQEDAFFARASEKIFLAPVKMALVPEVLDFHMPDAGTAHNLLIVKIRKSYPGQGMKVVSLLSGAGQMMFSKYIIAVSGDVNIRNYRELAFHIFRNISPVRDIQFSRGPLDVLDHSSDVLAFGGKAGIDATEKLPEELYGLPESGSTDIKSLEMLAAKLEEEVFINTVNKELIKEGLPLLPVFVNTEVYPEYSAMLRNVIEESRPSGNILLLVLDHSVDTGSIFSLTWQLLGNSDPLRDHVLIGNCYLVLDGTVKAGKSPRAWPNVVVSDDDTITGIDRKWESLGIGNFIISPSAGYRNLVRDGNDTISKNNEKI